MKELLSTPLLLNEAYKLAHTSPYGRFRLGAILAQRKSIISYGVNQKKSHPLQHKYTIRPHLQCWLHAEIHAISNAKAGDIINSDCYVARVLMDGTWGNSRPCAGCERALKDYGVKRVIYYQDGGFYRETLN